MVTVRLLKSRGRPFSKKDGDVKKDDESKRGMNLRGGYYFSETINKAKE